MSGVGLSTVNRAMHEVQPPAVNRGYATPQGLRLFCLVNVIAYAAASGITQRIEGSEFQIRWPSTYRSARRAFVSGEKGMNTVKFTKVCDERRPNPVRRDVPAGRQNHQAAPQTDGIDRLLDQFPGVTAEMAPSARDYAAITQTRRAPHRRSPRRTRRQRLSRPDSRPGMPVIDTHLRRARHRRQQELAALQRSTGRREYQPETSQAIGSLVSDVPQRGNPPPPGNFRR